MNHNILNIRFNIMRGSKQYVDNSLNITMPSLPLDDSVSMLTGTSLNEASLQEHNVVG